MPRKNHRQHQLSDPRKRVYEDNRGGQYTVKVVADPNGHHTRHGFRYSTVRVYAQERAS